MYYAQESNPTNIEKSKRKNPGLRPWPHKKNAPEKPSSRKVTSLHPKTSAQPQPASPAAPGARQGCSWRSAWTDDSHRGALRALQELGGAGPPPGISEMPEMSYFHSACAYIYYRPHLHSFAGIHPKDLTVLPYFHFATYNYEMWMEVPTMYYAQESNPTNIGKSKRKDPGLRPWPHKKNAPEKPPPGRSPLSIQRPQPRLSQLPLLPQKGRQVVHGDQRVRMIRTDVRFAPCKSSAVQGLRLASRDGTGGVGPQAWIRLRVLCGKGRKVGNGLEFGLMEKMSSTIVPCKMHT